MPPQNKRKRFTKEQQQRARHLSQLLNERLEQAALASSQRIAANQYNLRPADAEQYDAQDSQRQAEHREADSLRLSTKLDKGPITRKFLNDMRRLIELERKHAAESIFMLKLTNHAERKYPDFPAAEFQLIKEDAHKIAQEFTEC